MPTLELSRGVTAHTFAPPPKGFDPLKAGARELAAYGFPPRPQDPHLLGRWASVLRGPLTPVQAKFRTLERAAPKLPARAPLAPDALPAPTRTNYIGGATATTGPGQGDVRWIEGTFVLPGIYLPAGGDADAYPFSTWIGIFGDASTSSLLAGWDSYVFRSGRDLQRSHYVWWNWGPGDTSYMTNFFASPGDTLSIVLCLDLDSVVRARLSFYNLTTTQATSFIATAPRGTELQGDTAAWVVHNGIVDFEGPFIARFGEMYVDECNAGCTQGPAILHPTQRIVLTDFDHPDKDLVFANILSDTLLQMRYIGP
jgi:hypothetical protein